MRKGAGTLFLGVGLTLTGLSLLLRSAVEGGGAFLGTWLDHKPLPPARSTATQIPRSDSDRGPAEPAPGSITTGATLALGVAATIGCASAAREHRRRRSGGGGGRSLPRDHRAPSVSCKSYYTYRKDGLPELMFQRENVKPPEDNEYWCRELTQVVKGGDVEPAMTKVESALWADKRIEEISEFNPITDEEFAEEIEDLCWEWKRHWIPTLGWPTFAPRRTIKGDIQKKIILRHPELFKKYRYFKPLITRYPALYLRFTRTTERPQEDKRREWNPIGFYTTEKVAGFTYADWAKEVYGPKEPGEEWPKFKMDDIVPGKVVGLDPKGAFIEIGSKGWAWCPNDQCSLTPIGSAGEVLSVGQEVTVQIIYLDGLSKIRGDSFLPQIVVSITRITRLTAWEEVIEARDGRLEQEFEVEVVSMQPWGAVVRTKSGLEGIVPNANLGDLAGDGTLVGSDITVLLKEANEASIWTKAERPGDYGITFSYVDIVARKLGEELDEGQVVEAEVVRIEAGYLTVRLMGITCNIRKIDVSGDVNFDIANVFEPGEQIKCYVLETVEGIRLSIRALEGRRGAILTNKAEVFERAEETAKKYFATAKAEKEKFEQNVANVLDLSAKPAPAPTRAKSTIVEEDDDADDF